ncbi:MAG: 3-deoxy-manno-octulosonate cytidylyltransferase (CMP-KDO synthetase) [Lysobacterales bacterium]|jgi:3-deoxy-manno-octulosonate cytidylyltransferase (CMP-KDO synthetase)
MSASIDYCVVIPARFESQRLPGKVLLDIAGKPLLQHVWERAVQSTARQVVIATDHELIMEAAAGFGAEVVMTSSEHSSGSDRIAECAQKLGWDDGQIIVNLQGDEPLMPAQCLQQVAALLINDDTADAASLYWPIDDEQELGDPNVVKVVIGRAGQALIFSRSPIPFPRDFTSFSEAIEAGIQWFRHLGLYAYKSASLAKFSKTAPTTLECTERLEQLRYLESGGRIVLQQACSHIPAGVDTMEDLERIRKVLC